MSTTPPFGPLFGFGDDEDPQSRPGKSSGPGGSDAFDLGSMFPGMAGVGSPDLGAIFTQLGQLFSWNSGPVNWDLCTNISRQTPQVAGDAPVTCAQTRQVSEAINLAQLWLDPVTCLPAPTLQAQAWSRSEWVHHTLEQWKPYVEPVAEKVNSAFGEVLNEQLPEEVAADPASAQLADMGGQLQQLLNPLGAAMFGTQVGQALAGLAQEVFATTDIGLPLGPHGVAALLPTNVAEFAEQVQRPETEVLHYLALREAATLRLFAHAGWLIGRLHTDITRYASEITIDVSRLEDATSQLDPALLTDPSLLEDPQAGTIILEDLFKPEHTPEQQRVLQRLEGLLALIEGWVETVVTAAATPHMPAVAALSESMRRRRATGGPAELTFANLVGLQLRPRRLREAAQLWKCVETTRGLAQRDAVWDHPDYLPDPEDLDDPEAFAARRSASADDVVDLSQLDLESDNNSGNATVVKPDDQEKGPQEDEQ